ncbi:hypothetical protein LTR36_010467 [Oleoguttula mirabilis]|uniref:Uncharacterized protein n=1 Tax=Oleoguttula mirabilis TaxID=1507867 RepID=A0AAV9J4B1_9PEZI|nr:hypothetical protein LTR36_010467 [Oleoguttula mirabilis]
MPSSQGIPHRPANASISPQSSATPLLELEQQSQQGEGDGTVENVDPKTGKRRLLGFGSKNKEDKQAPQKMDAPVTGLMPQTQAAVNAMKPGADLRPQPIPISSARLPYPSGAAASPSRLRSSSPRLHSPASSEIFERSVQEPVPMSTLQSDETAHIPSHVMTEDHIPPALEATAQAITSGQLNADEVEIVTSSTHQPAGASVLEGSSSHADLTQLQSAMLQHHKSEDSEAASYMHQSGMLPTGADDEGASNYGQLDPNDVRRLSFISFADVVQSEHQQHMASQLREVSSRDSLHIAGLPSSVPSVAPQGTTSPLRSPRSPVSSHSHSFSGEVVTPPPGVSDQLPARSGAAIGGPSQHGELTIETMRQAVRKTASGDLSGVRNAGMSPISDESSLRETRSRTNT